MSVPTDIGPAPHPTVLRMQILTTEHWSLLSSRSLAWNEAFARVGMHLTVLSGAMVALGLVAGRGSGDDLFSTAALVILPIVLFIGVTTVLRLGATNYHDATAVVGMNRIRAAYLELAPELRPIFVMGVTDDAAGVARTMAVPPGLPGLAHLLAAAPFLVNVLNGVVTAAIVALVSVRLGGPALLAAIAGLIAASSMVAVQLRLVNAAIRRGRATLYPMFPSLPPDHPVGTV